MRKKRLIKTAYLSAKYDLMTSLFENHNIDTNTLPRLETQTFSGLEKKYIWVLMIRNICIALSFILTITIASYFIEIPNSQWYVFVGYISIAILFVLSILWTVLAFPKKSFLLRHHDISYRSGLIVKKMISVPKNRIQHVEIRQAIVLRLFKLSKIVIFTAGGSGSDLSISGLKPELAERIKENLSQSVSEETIEAE